MIESWSESKELFPGVWVYKNAIKKDIEPKMTGFK